MQLNPLPSHSFPLSFEVPFPFPSKPPKEKKNPFLPPGPFVVVPLIVKSSRFPPLPVLPQTHSPTQDRFVLVRLSPPTLPSAEQRGPLKHERQKRTKDKASHKKQRDQKKALNTHQEPSPPGHAPEPPHKKRKPCLINARGSITTKDTQLPRTHPPPPHQGRAVPTHD